MQTMQSWPQLSAEQQKALLSRPAQANNAERQQQVAAIIQRVRTEGDNALLQMTADFDGVQLNDLRLSAAKQAEAIQALKPDVKEAIDLAYANIQAFHQAQIPQDVAVETRPGVNCELKHAPLAAVGLYIPGGSAPLPSTVLMLGIPAQVAGCPRKVLCSPPNKNGSLAPEICYAAKLCNIDEIYLVGGAQAVAAMAYGTDSIAKVDKIFGPGNSYVTEAKQQVSQDAAGAAIDMPAGPSEVLVLADANANPAFVAADLLSQAEHGPDSQAVLVSPSEALIGATQAEIERQLAKLSRRDIAAQSIANSRFILTTDLDEACAVSNAYAPEHLIVQTDNADDLLGSLTNAGSIFVGAYAPESAGDYASGTNHVLPTYGYARNYSSLGLLDFYRRYTVQSISQQGLEQIGPAIMQLAAAEGLDAHKNAVAIRLGVEL